MTINNLLEYDDFRVFLRDVIAQESSGESTISASRFADAFGLSRSALSMVLSGSRDLALASIHRIAKAIKLTQSDHEYLEALVLKCQAKDEETRIYYQTKLQQKLKERKTLNIVTPSKALISEWFVPALLVYLIDISDKEEDHKILAKRLNISEENLNSILLLLQKEGFLEFKGKGNVHISFNRLTSIISSKRYMKSVIQAAIDSLEQHYSDTQYWFLSHTFSITENDVRVFAEEYKTLVEKYISQTSVNGNKLVYQVSAQIMPVC